MESFANRVDMVFGSLQVTSSWRLNPQDSQQKERLHKQRQDSLDEEEDDDDETPCWDAKSRGQQCSFDGMEVEGDLEEEGRSIRQMVGLDSTLDHEDEEDEFDKAAFGLDGSEDDRLYMKGIQEVDRKLNTSRSLPSSLYDLKKSRRDPRANHSAAKARLEEDAKAATVTNASMEATHSAKVSDEDVRDMTENGNGVKRSSEDVLVSQESPPAGSEERVKPSKRVRFALDLQEPGDVKVNTQKEFVRHKPNSAHVSQVPDHVRNPSKYTHYTLDWSVEDNDMSNFEAFKACGETLQTKVEEVSFFSEEVPDKIQFVHKHDRTSSNAQKGNTEEANRSIIVISRTMCIENLESESGNGERQSDKVHDDDAMDFKTEDGGSHMVVEKQPTKAAKNYRTRRDSEEGMDT